MCALQAASSFALNFLWLEKNIAVAVDHVVSEVRLTPPHAAFAAVDEENMLEHGALTAAATAAEPEEPAHRVLLLAEEGRMGGAEKRAGEQALGV